MVSWNPSLLGSKFVQVVLAVLHGLSLGKLYRRALRGALYRPRRVCGMDAAGTAPCPTLALGLSETSGAGFSSGCVPPGCMSACRR